MILNDSFEILPKSYLFSEVAAKLRRYREEHPEADIVRMDIGDVTQPIVPAALEAMHKAVDDMADPATFHGYGPEQGYAFLRDAIARHDYADRGLAITADDIFISDGAKSDLGNLGDLFGENIIIALPDPGYPVYSDANVIDCRAGVLNSGQEESAPGDRPLPGRWSNFIYLEAKPENGFVPQPPKEHADVVYLCFPNNPTGAAITVPQLQAWVDYALREQSLIIYDSAYESYITEPGIARSIYECEGAEKCAIEVRSFSKTAGFTGLRCGYTVVPKALKGQYSDGKEEQLQTLWNRRQCTKFNGASYVIQRGAEALFTPEGRKQVREVIELYMENARVLREALADAGMTVYGGVNAPYIWLRCPEGMTSWETFDYLLDRCHISSTPGSGFGRLGEGFVRLTAFNTPANTRLAALRITSLLSPNPSTSTSTPTPTSPSPLSSSSKSNHFG